jgi:hypothetical protein
LLSLLLLLLLLLLPLLLLLLLQVADRGVHELPPLEQIQWWCVRLGVL